MGIISPQKSGWKPATYWRNHSLKLMWAKMERTIFHDVSPGALTIHLKFQHRKGNHRKVFDTYPKWNHQNHEGTPSQAICSTVLLIRNFLNSNAKFQRYNSAGVLVHPLRKTCKKQYQQHVTPPPPKTNIVHRYPLKIDAWLKDDD